MRKLLLPLSLILLAACHRNDTAVQRLQPKTDSLQLKTDSAYTPEFGGFMSSI